MQEQQHIREGKGAQKKETAVWSFTKHPPDFSQGLVFFSAKNSPIHLYEKYEPLHYGLSNGNREFQNF